MSAAPGPSARQVLEPCPFCGGEAGSLRSELNGEWRVWCLRPRAACGIISAYRETEAEAIAAWNRRATDPAVAEAMKLAGRIAEAADVYIAGMEDGPVDTDERHDQVQRLAAAHRTLIAIGPLETAILARALLAKHAAQPQEKDHG